MFGNNRKLYIKYFAISLLPIISHILVFLLFNTSYLVNSILYVISMIVFIMISNIVLIAILYKIQNKNTDYLHIIITMILNSINISLRLLSTIYIVYLGINIYLNINAITVYNTLLNVVQFLIGSLIILIITQSFSLYDKIYTIKYYKILLDNTNINKKQNKTYVILQFIPILDIISFYFCICTQNKYNKIFKFTYIFFSILFCYIESLITYFNLTRFI